MPIRLTKSCIGNSRFAYVTTADGQPVQLVEHTCIDLVSVYALNSEGLPVPATGIPYASVDAAVEALGLVQS